MSVYVYVFLELNSDKVRENTYGAFDWIDGPTTSAFWAPFWRSLESSRPTKPNKNISQYFIPGCNSRAHNTQEKKKTSFIPLKILHLKLSSYIFFFLLTHRKENYFYIHN